jgi:hypothetical protein
MHFFNYKKLYKKCKTRIKPQRQRSSNVFSQLKIWICSPMRGYCHTSRQRVLNYMKRTRLSRRRMIFPPPPPSGSCLSFSIFLYVARRAFWTGEGGGGEGWAKAWSSMNHSILSAGGAGINHQSCGHDGREGVLLAHNQLLVLVRDVTL